jgi:hypothetical protein
VRAEEGEIEVACEQQSGTFVGAGMVGLLVSGGYLGAWYLAVERPTCEETGMFACTGPAILMYIVGVPVTYLVWSLGLRAVRVPLPWLVPVAVLLLLIVIVPVAEVVEPPNWVWPFVAAVACGLWARLFKRAPQE